MLITDGQSGLKQFRGMRDFAAVCMFESRCGNAFLRQMENPQHNQFEPDRLREKDRSRGRKALRRLSRWIRKNLAKLAGPQESNVSEELDELADFLPDAERPGPFEPEDILGVAGKAQRRPIRVKSRPPRGVLDDKGEWRPLHPGKGRRSSRSTRRQRKPLREAAISNVRVLPVRGQRNRRRASFTSLVSGRVQLVVAEARDTGRAMPSGLRLFDAAGMVLKGGRMDVTKNKKFLFDFAGSQLPQGISWSVVAYVVKD